ncbi:MAG: hypothetical protein IPL39_15665 [Opitutaceae bacterium]|nr:hypothetical protein [Opitutaceae bacterium]
MTFDSFPFWFGSLGMIVGIALVVFARPLGKAKKAQSDKLGFGSIPESGWIFFMKAFGGSFAGICLLILLATQLKK